MTKKEKMKLWVIEFVDDVEGRDEFIIGGKNSHEAMDTIYRLFAGIKFSVRPYFEPDQYGNYKK